MRVLHREAVKHQKPSGSSRVRRRAYPGYTARYTLQIPTAFKKLRRRCEPPEHIRRLIIFSRVFDAPYHPSHFRSQIDSQVNEEPLLELCEDRQMVAHTQQVVGALESLFSTVQDAETGLRASTRFAIEPASRQACRPKVPHGWNREASEALNLDKSATNRRYVRAMERLKVVLTAMPGSREDLPS